MALPGWASLRLNITTKTWYPGRQFKSCNLGIMVKPAKAALAAMLLSELQPAAGISFTVRTNVRNNWGSVPKLQVTNTRLAKH